MYSIIQLKEKFLDLLFPRQCIGCGKMGSFLCSLCAQSLLPLEPPYCKKCGASTAGEEFCPSCSRASLVIDGIRSPFLFGGLIREAIHHFKYGNFKALAPSLAQLLAEYLYQNPLPVEVLVPVPIHKKRLRRRGYNQSSLLA